MERCDGSLLVPCLWTRPEWGSGGPEGRPLTNLGHKDPDRYLLGTGLRLKGPGVSGGEDPDRPVGLSTERKNSWRRR